MKRKYDKTDEELNRLQKSAALLNGAVRPSGSCSPEQLEKLLAAKPNTAITPHRRYRRIITAAVAAVVAIAILVGGASVYSHTVAPVPQAITVTGRTQLIHSLNRIYTMRHSDLSGNIFADIGSFLFGAFYLKGYSSFDLVEDSPPSKDENVSADTSEHSEVNKQESGVDEADIIRTDGNFIYYLVRENDDISCYTVFRIVDAEKLDIVYEEKLASFFAGGMYLVGSRAVITGAVYGEYDERDMYPSENSAVYIYDLSNPFVAKLQNSYTYAGRINSTRMIGNMLYIVTNKDCYISQKLDSDSIDSYLPSYACDGEQHNVDYGDICVIEDSSTSGYILYAAVDTASGEQRQVGSVYGSGGAVYCSQNALYIAGSCGSDTAFFKLPFSPDGTFGNPEQFTVPGYVLNQYSMSEYNGYFRVATTRTPSVVFGGDFISANETGSGIYIIGSDLRICGKIEGIAKGEQIKSARFDGDMGYIVTYLQTDPLFAVDLSDPEKPVLLGELKIPGFSTYLHPLGNGQLIGIGYDDAMSLKISLFDASDPKNPSELDICNAAAELSCFNVYTPALYNFAAFSYDERYSRLLLFVTGDSYDGSYRSGMLVIRIADGKLVCEFDDLSPVPSEMLSFDSGRCLYIGDSYYAASNCGITKYNSSFEITAAITFQNN